jgi:hypothetical protein
LAFAHSTNKPATTPTRAVRTPKPTAKETETPVAAPTPPVTPSEPATPTASETIAAINLELSRGPYFTCGGQVMGDSRVSLSSGTLRLDETTRGGLNCESGYDLDQSTVRIDDLAWEGLIASADTVYVDCTASRNCVTSCWLTSEKADNPPPTALCTPEKLLTISIGSASDKTKLVALFRHLLRMNSLPVSGAARP